MISGTGKSKKLAKRNAASAMLQMIRQGNQIPPADGEAGDDYDDDSIPLVSFTEGEVDSCHLKGVGHAALVAIIGTTPLVPYPQVTATHLKMGYP